MWCFYDLVLSQNAAEPGLSDISVSALEIIDMDISSLGVERGTFYHLL